LRRLADILDAWLLWASVTPRVLTVLEIACPLSLLAIVVSQLLSSWCSRNKERER
jgi:hypothetical protein